MRSARTHAWWRVLVDGGAEEVDVLVADGDDPWADWPAPAPVLTAAQRAHLGALDDQPPVPRLSGRDDEENDE
jgi:hypothetical protein